MSASTVEQDATRLLAEAIAAGRLSAKPDPAALARIASIVNSALTATAPQKRRTARGVTTQAVPKEASCVGSATSSSV
jgi:hypothetical protein